MDKINLKKIQNIILLMTVIFLLILQNNIINITVGLAVTLFFLVNFLNNIRKEIAIVDLIFLICVLQLVFFPIINFDNMNNLPNYLSIMLPAFFFFYFGFKWNIKKNYFNDIGVEKFFEIGRNTYWSKVIILTGILGVFLSSFTSNAFVNLLNNFSGIAILFSLGLMKKSKKYWYYPSIFFLIILFQSIRSAVFAPVISFGLLAILYIPMIFNLTKRQIIVLFVCCFFVLNLFQNAKLVYREMVWKGENRSYDFGLFLQAMLAPKQEKSMSAIERANSGSVIAEIYDYVPKKYPHLYGRQLLEDLSNGLIPRFLYSDKKEIDTRANYMRYTGRYVEDNVSVGINVFGISYAEFGVIGSWIFMFFFGQLLNRMYNFLVALFTVRRGYNIFLLTIPSVFISFVKFEQEFVGQFVGFVKLYLILVFIYIIFKSKLQFSYENTISS
ncbi:hypothetical protein [Sphingobacterium sp. G1-14]|uniref:hypothetical protein n=1 Tax=Sphingobacterium sp. G1-14 TaxID=2003121 RepID=UPI0012FD0DD9|nr:hypothetical protein [Sphingobacterium sp. G1-14]